MPRFARPCLRCGKLSNDSHCDEHKRELNALRQAKKDTPERLARKRVLYNSTYRQRRKLVLATATHCAICSKPFTPTDAVDTDHIIANNPTSPLQATHAYCNRSKGNRPHA